MEQFNNGRKKEETGSGDWQRPAQSCCRNEIPLLQRFLLRSSIRVKILIFTLRSKNLEQGTRKEEGTGKQSNNRTSEQFNNGAGNGEVRSGDWQRSALPCCRRNEIPLLQLFLIRSSIRVKIPLSYFIIDFLSCIFDDMLILLCFLFR